MGDGSGGVCWFSAPGFMVVGIDDSAHDVVVEVETTDRRAACRSCGVFAKVKDRRTVTLRDAPAGGRPVSIRWRKRVFVCREPECSVRTWTERCDDFVLPRRVLTERAVRWATDRIAAVEATPASLGREFGVTWSTVWAGVERHSQQRVDDRGRVGDVTQIGFDETVMSPAKRHRRRRFITSAVDLTTGRVIDVFDGRDAADLDRWLLAQPADWVGGIRVVAVDPHPGYRSAIVRSELLAEVTVVVDAFHIVRLANQAVTKCRQRVQQETFEHRGWKGDPLYDIRRLLLLGAERVDERGWERIHTALADGDPDGEVRDTWVAKELVRDVYLATSLDDATAALDAAVAWCTDPDATIEQRTLAKTLVRWRSEILARHTTGASNGRVEAANLTIKHVKRSGRGFRNLGNYRLRILLAAGCPRQTHRVTRHRARPSSVA